MLGYDRYCELRQPSRVRERTLFGALHTPTELELQARWFAGEFGRTFTSTTGDQIEIVQFGTWNREAGPDFRDASIRINGGQPIGGSVEIDLVDRSWETHEHAINPAFEDTVLHVFCQKNDKVFFTRTKANREVRQILIDPTSLPDAFNVNVPLAHAGRCHAPLRDLPPDQLNSVLSGAAQFRVRRKAALISAKIDARGYDEALFQAIAAALGFKENKLPFTLLAQRLPLKVLRKVGDDAESVLFGVAGFLESPDLAVYSGPTRAYLRQLWEKWWPHRDGLQRLILPKSAWHLTGTRPVNHPQRRLAALSILARDWPAFGTAVNTRTTKALAKYLGSCEHRYWNHHYTLTSEPNPKSMALIGNSRITDILVNILFPVWSSQGDDAVWAQFAKMPAALSNRRVETGATRLFGDDPRRLEVLKTVVGQQAILQIYEDFCLQDNSDCANCPFPEQLKCWTA